MQHHQPVGHVRAPHHVYVCASIRILHAHLYMIIHVCVNIYMQYIHVCTYMYICIRCNGTSATLGSCVDLGFNRKSDSTLATRRNAYYVHVFGHLLRRPRSRDRTSDTSDRMSRPIWPDRTTSSRVCLEITSSRGQMVI